MIATLVAVFLTHAALAAEDVNRCFCNGKFEAGMTVHTIVANPRGAPDLPKGSCGQVVCSEPHGKAVLVVWFNWYNGDPASGKWCACGHEAFSQTKSWWVMCKDLKPGCPPARGACCLRGSCVWSSERTCTARGGLYMGDGVSCRTVCNCGQGWQHEDINGDGDVDIEDFLRVLGRWGQQEADRPREDINGDCTVGIEDLIRIFEHWGPPPPRGACCNGELCSIEAEDACVSVGGRWWGADVSCNEVLCVDADELGDQLCNCDGQFRVGDRVTLLRHHRGPGLAVGHQGTAIAAHDPEQGAFPGMITVLWDDWVEERPEIRAQQHRNGLWAIHCGWHAFLDRWSTTKVYCQDLLGGEHDIDTSGACCIDGVWCRLATADSCMALGGVYAGDDTACRPSACDGPIECACEGEFRVGDRVALERHVNWPDGLRRGLKGEVLAASEHSPDVVLVYFDLWRGGGRIQPDSTCGYRADPADRLETIRITQVPCDALVVMED
ncbi:MAG: hypothetical protein MK101_11695 [Phycisphaerales bacterium]|nr:hypothetical protein [Phycisphaerales bacterium]